MPSSAIKLEEHGKKIAQHSLLFLKKLFPVEGNKNKLELIDAELIPNTAVTYEEEMQLKDRGQTKGDKVKAHFQLKDKATGAILDKKKTVVMQVPSVTDRGTFIIKGNEYQVFNQLRLDPAIYTYKDGAGEIQTQFNLEKGMNFKMNVDPKTQKFQMKVGTSTVDAFPVMKLMGVSEDEMKKTWGSKMFVANKELAADNSLQKLHDKLFRKPAANEEEMLENIKTYFNETKMRGETNQITIGKRSNKVDKDSLLLASKKNLDVAFGRTPQDERDHMQFQTLHTAPDLINHRLEHFMKPIQQRVKFKVDSKDKIGNIVGKNVIDKVIETFFSNTDLSSTKEQTNPLHMYTNSYKVTRMGEGGIGNEQQITRQARNVHPSQFGFVDPYQTPESSRIGVTTDLALGARVRHDGRMTTQLFNLKKKRLEDLTPYEISKATVSFSDQFDKNGKPLFNMVEAMRNGKPVKVSPSKVDFMFPTEHHLFSLSASMVPFQDSTQGNRKMMAGKQITQYNMLKHREAPLVQVSRSLDGHSLEEGMGKINSVSALRDGEVKQVYEDEIVIKTEKGLDRYPLYKDFYLNEKAYLQHDPKVKVGDKIKKNQLLADSHTTKEGVWAPGINLNVAYMPYRGKNFEDGVVISESGAKKMTSFHSHKFEVPFDEESSSKKKKFLSHFPAIFNKKQLEKIGEDGLPKMGQKLEYGDPIILNMKKRRIRPEDVVLGLVSKKFEIPFSDKTETWKYEFPGEVVRTFDNKGNKMVRIKTEEGMVVGDKISGRHGNKGIITDILPDHEMPQDRDGKPVELLLSPQGVVGRINPSQLLETSLGKVAKKAGKSIKVKNYNSKIDNDDFVLNQLKKHGLSEKEELFDPKNKNKSMGKINTGYQMILKLDHPVRKKLVARGIGPNYTSDMAPGSGLKGGGRSIGQMELYALLAHGSKENLREISTVKSDRNDDFWYRFQTGQPYNIPRKTPFITQKLFDYMKVLGVDHKIQGKNIQLSPISDADTLHNSGGKVNNARLLRSKETGVVVEKQGLFDPKIFGRSGIDGTKWGHIELEKSIPNPLFEDAIKGLTGLTGPQFDRIMKGEDKVRRSDGGIIKMASDEEDSLTGPEGISHLLSRINVEKDYKKLRDEANTTRSATKRNEIFKKMKFYRGLKRLGVTPDIYMTKNIPVLPPLMRSIVPLPDGNLIVADINHAYKDLISVNNALKEDRELGFGDEQTLTNDVYRATKALQGLGKPISYGKEFSGVIDTIKGQRNKTGLFQGKAVKRKQEISGSSTIIPNSKLGVDEVKLPEPMAWKIFEPHMKREMSPFYNSLEVKDHLDNKTPVAKRFLEKTMDKNFVMLNRAPTLHKGSIMAFRPSIGQRHAIEIPNLVVSPFNADFDGDCFAGAVLQRSVVKNYNTDFEKKINNASKKSYDGKVPNECSAGNYFDIGGDMPYEGNIKYDSGRMDIQELKKFKGKLVKKNERVEEYEVDPTMVQVMSFNEKTHEWEWVGVSRFSTHYNLEHFDVKYKSGRIVNCSNDASLYVVPKGEMKPRRLKPSESINFLSPNPNKMTINSSIEKIDLLPYNDGDKRVGTKIESIELTKDFGWVVGCITGDGWANVDCGINKKYGEVVNCLASDVTITAIKSTHKFEGHECYSEKRTFSSEDLAWFLHKELGKGVYNKKLPSFTLEAPEEFRWGLLSGMIDTDGSICWVKAKSKNKEQFNIKYDTKSEALKDDLCALCWSLGIRTSIHEYRGGYLISLRSADVKDNIDKFYIQHEKKKENLEKLRIFDLVPDQTDYLPITEYMVMQADLKYKSLFASTGDKKYVSKYVAWRNKQKNLRVPRNAVKTLFEDFPELRGDVQFSDLVDVYDSGLTYDIVKSVTKNKGRKTMYDITVPGSYTFLTADGTALFDTMSVHVPVSVASKAEAEKMLPSNILFNPRDKALFFTPSQEAILGLYNMTRKGGKNTGLKFNSVDEAVENRAKIGAWNNRVEIGGIKAPLGSHMVNSVLPKNIRDYSLELDKGNIRRKLEEVAKHNKGDYARVVNHMKDFGYEASTGEGNTISIEDFTGMKADKLKMFKDMEKQISTLEKKPNVTKSELYNAKVKMMGDVVKSMENKQHTILNSRDDNGVQRMLASGSRGTSGQVRQVMGSPVMVKDFFDNAVDVPMKKGYIEGQSLMESMFSAQSARSGAIDKVSGVSEPGMFAKLLVGTNITTVITEKDCGTTGGTLTNPRDAIDRYLSEDHPKLRARRNDLVGTDLAGEAEKNKMKLKIRTQMHCLSKNGICSKCYGIDEHGHEVEMGKAVGIIDAQSLAEPLTQAAMKQFHTGGLAKQKVKRAMGFDRIKQLYTVPENLPDRGIMSELDGKITKMSASPAGGYDIFVGDKHHYSPSPAPIVKRGESVKKGQILSDGYLKPQDILRLNGKGAAQKYMVDELKHTMETLGVRANNTRAFETVVNNQTNRGKITKSNHPDFLVGDITKTKHLEEAKRDGFKLEYDPLVRSIERAPLDDTVESNLFQDMNFREIEKSMKKNVAFGQKIHFQNTIYPIASYIMGNFGRDERGNKVELF